MTEIVNPYPRFPNTAEGRAQAAAIAGKDGWWEEFIDFSADYADEETVDTTAPEISDGEDLALRALALVIKEDPTLFTTDQLQSIDQAIHNGPGPWTVDTPDIAGYGVDEAGE